MEDVVLRYSTTMGASAGATILARKCFQLTPTRTATAIASVPTKDRVKSSNEASLPSCSGIGVDSMGNPIPNVETGNLRSHLPLFR
jgi:hypothetical protein